MDDLTGTHIFKECLLGLLGSNTVIYIMHQVELLPAADPILAMYRLRSQSADPTYELPVNNEDLPENDKYS